MKVLVVRFSALGDVALTLPVIRAALQYNPELEITFLSRSFFKPMFEGIERFSFHGVDLQSYKGLTGLWKLTKELDELQRFDLVIDLHNSLRTKIICSIFRLWRVKSYTIDKGKNQKKLLTRKRNKKLLPLKHTTERYADVFSSAGLDLQLGTDSHMIQTSEEAKKQARAFYNQIPQAQYIGIAPFSAHELKNWGVEKFKELIQKISTQKPAVHVLLFGSPSDVDKLQDLRSDFRNVTVVGLLEGGFETELAVIERLSCMVTLDSANMHFAALLGVRVVAIFGPTHPYLGFGPYLQALNVIQLEDLECRPCTVFGNTTCFRGDHFCMQGLTIQSVYDRL